MIARLLLVGLIFFTTSFLLLWVLMFSNYMNGERWRAVIRCGALSALAAAITIGLMAVVVNLDVFFHNTITG